MPRAVRQVSARALVWNFTGAVVLRLSAMILLPAVCAAMVGGWRDVGGELASCPSSLQVQFFMYNV